MDKNGDKKPWDDSFTDDRNQEGNLSRMAKRKQKGNFKLILAVLISIIALIAIFSLAFGMSKQDSVQQSQATTTKNTKKTTKPKKKTDNKKKKSNNSNSKKTSEKQTGPINNQSVVSENQVDPNSQVTDPNQQANNTATVNPTNQDSVAKNTDDPQYTTVGQSEGLYRVATNAGISVSQLQALNGLDSTSVIAPGQKLRIK